MIDLKLGARLGHCWPHISSDTFIVIILQQHHQLAAPLLKQPTACHSGAWYSSVAASLSHLDKNLSPLSLWCVLWVWQPAALCRLRKGPTHQSCKRTNPSSCVLCVSRQGYSTFKYYFNIFWYRPHLAVFI